MGRGLNLSNSRPFEWVPAAGLLVEEGMTKGSFGELS